MATPCERMPRCSDFNESGHDLSSRLRPLARSGFKALTPQVQRARVSQRQRWSPPKQISLIRLTLDPPAPITGAERKAGVDTCSAQLLMRCQPISPRNLIDP